MALDVAALGGCPVEDVVGRLDASGCLQLAEEVAGTDEGDTGVDHGTALERSVSSNRSRASALSSLRNKRSRVSMAACSPRPRMERPSSRRRCWSMPMSVGAMRTLSALSLIQATICSAPGAP